jgi:hypothetical protein
MANSSWTPGRKRVKLIALRHVGRGYKMKMGNLKSQTNGNFDIKKHEIDAFLVFTFSALNLFEI